MSYGDSLMFAYVDDLRAWRGSERSRCSCEQDRKSTRLNSSHITISYAVFCLKKKKKTTNKKTTGCKKDQRTRTVQATRQNHKNKAHNEEDDNTRQANKTDKSKTHTCAANTHS